MADSMRAAYDKWLDENARDIGLQQIRDDEIARERGFRIWKAALAEQPAQGEAVRAGTVRHTVDDGASTTQVIWIGDKPRPGTAVYLAPPATSVLDRRSLIEMVDAAMVEMANIHPPLKRSECERLIRAAMLSEVPEPKP